MVAPRMPALNSLVLDKELCFAEHIRINPVIVINKIDLDEKKTNEIFEIYTKAGFKVIKMQAEKGEGISHLKEVLKSNTSVLAGESGVR
ncbi:MAG: GTPase RsgA [Clostridia bacterium]|nr:GTPase RsgA [Clostridia bacterium]